MNNSKRTLWATSLLVAALGLGQMAQAASSQDNGYRQIRNIVWDKNGSRTLEPVNSRDIPDNQGNLIFIRPDDNDSKQTSTNVGIEGRFQVSIQPGYFSQVLYCGGSQNVNVTLTGNKNNDLINRNRQTVEVLPKRNNFFLVDVDDATKMPSITKINADMAATLLRGKTQQAHQISRVNADCPEMIYVAPIVPVVPAIPNVPQAPEREQIELFKPFRLNVLFQFDKDVVQPIYNQRIRDLADYLAAYPDTVALLEGHTDSKGSAEYNLDLSRRRAAAVKRELVNFYGADPSRLMTQGYGESRPIDTNDTDAGRQNNRRVVAIVSPR